MNREMKRDQESIDFLKRSMHWPQWPACPVKRYFKRGSWPDMGLVFDTGSWTVYRVNLFSFTKEQLESCEKHEYESAEAMVADGWEVD